MWPMTYRHFVFCHRPQRRSPSRPGRHLLAAAMLYSWGSLCPWSIKHASCHIFIHSPRLHSVSAQSFIWLPGEGLVDTRHLDGWWKYHCQISQWPWAASPINHWTTPVFVLHTQKTRRKKKKRKNIWVKRGRLMEARDDGDHSGDEDRRARGSFCQRGGCCWLGFNIHLLYKCTIGSVRGNAEQSSAARFMTETGTKVRLPNLPGFVKDTQSKQEVSAQFKTLNVPYDLFCRYLICRFCPNT